MLGGHMLTCLSFVAIKEYLWKLSCERRDRRTDRQTEVINTFQLSLESVKKSCARVGSRQRKPYHELTR